MKEVFIIIGMTLLVIFSRCPDRRDRLTEEQNNNEDQDVQNTDGKV
jgi:hypothetical protein